MNWFQRQLVRMAGKVLDKYDCQYVDMHSKLMVRGTLYQVTSYIIHDSEDEHPSVDISGTKRG